MSAVGGVGGSEAYQADDARGSLLVTHEKKTLAGLGSPGNVGVSSLGRLLSLEVGREDLGLDSLDTEVEELLSGDQVPEGVALANDVANSVNKIQEKLTWGS
jgi:hypothetical protein